VTDRDETGLVVRRPVIDRRVAILGAVGLAGSVALVVGGALAGGSGPIKGTGWLWSVPSIPLPASGRLLPALALFYGGLAVLTRAWLRLRAHGRTKALPQGLVLAVFALWALPALLGPPLASRDVYSYAAIGELLNHGLDPYAVGPGVLGDDPSVTSVDPTWRNSPTPYGPLFLLLARGVRLVGGGHPVPSVLLFRLLALAGLGLVAWGVPRLARAYGRDPVDALLLVLCNPLTLLHLVSGAHNEAVMVGLLVAGLALGRDRPVLGAACCGLAGAVKFPALLGAVYIGWTAAGAAAPLLRRVTGMVRASAASAGSLAVVTLVTGAGWGWARAVTGGLQVDGYLSPVGFLAIVARWTTKVFGMGAGVGSLVTAGRLGGLVLAAGIGAWLIWRSDDLGLVAPASAFVLLAVLGPSTQPWYLLWGMAIMAAAVAGTPARAFVLVSVVMSFAVLPVGPRLGDELLRTHHPLQLVAALVLLLPLTMRWPRRTPEVVVAASP